MKGLTNRTVGLNIDIIRIMITIDSLHLVMFVKERMRTSATDRITKCQNIDIIGVLHLGLRLNGHETGPDGW